MTNTSMGTRFKKQMVGWITMMVMTTAMMLLLCKKRDTKSEAIVKNYICESRCEEGKDDDDDDEDDDDDNVHLDFPSFSAGRRERQEYRRLPTM